MASIAFGHKIARANFAHLEKELADFEFATHQKQISQLAKDALSRRRDFTRSERYVIGLLAYNGEDTYRKVKQFCERRELRLLPLLMKLAPNVPIEDLRDKGFDLRYQTEEPFRLSIDKNDWGIPEQIIFGIFLGGLNSCDRFQEEFNQPLIISVLGSRIRAMLHFEQRDENEICLMDIPDDGSQFDRLVEAASDPDAPVSEWFEKTFKEIDQARIAGRCVLIHCHAGQSRSSTLLAAYLIKRFGLTADEAIHFLIMKRKAVMPNRGFMEGLRKYAATLPKGKE